ncbi:MAG: transposase [Chlamydiae bacterium]|nr:transposase [Chlamydiota bacterium]
MPQRFCHPRTPNDNPFIESAFSTVKHAPQYPGRFRDEEEGGKYFDEYFPWYNSDHYHLGICYVTPNDTHRGLMSEIMAHRKKTLKQQQLYRKEANQKTLTGQNSRISLIQKPVGFVA